MPAPRRVLAGDTNFFTRNTTQRQYLMTPSKKLRQIYLYCLAEAAERFSITLFAFIAMSTHHHIVSRDNYANHPKFIEHLGKMLAKAINHHWDRCQNVFATEQPNVCLIARPEDVLEKILYTLANAVEADAVERCADWPGAISLQLMLSGESMIIPRPKGYFSDEGVMPEFVELRVGRPPGYEDMPQEKFAAMILERLREIEEAARVRRREEGRRVEGRKSVLARKHTDRPTTPWPRRTIRPTVACRDPERMKQELASLRAFRVAHRAALDKLRARRRGVIFPAGTYRVKLFGVRCVIPEQQLWVIVHEEPAPPEVPRPILALPARTGA